MTHKPLCLTHTPPHSTALHRIPPPHRSLLRVLDTCLLLDLLKHTKAAPLPDLLWFRRAVQSGRVDAAKGSDTDSDLEVGQWQAVQAAGRS
ncbi:unnamed protein product [Closterium sp. NIES-53]